MPTTLPPWASPTNAKPRWCGGATRVKPFTTPSSGKTDATEPECLRLREGGFAAMVQQKTGLLIDAYFSATKLQWILDNVSGARALAEAGQLAFGTVDSWLMWHLTGGAVHATDVSNASRTMLFNIHTHHWDDELLALFRIPASVLPEVYPSVHSFGATQAPMAGRRMPYRGCGWRSAKRFVWPSLFPSRPSQKHLWHRLLHADAHRR
jgi:glycerol kinase